MKSSAQHSDTTTAADPATRAHVPGALVRLVRAAARSAARRPKTIIAVWLLFVVGCIGVGSMVGATSLTSVQQEVGQSAEADALLHDANLANPAVENVLVSSSSAQRTAQATTDLRSLLGALPEVASVRGPTESPTLSVDAGRTVLVQVTMRGDPQDAPDHVAAVEQAVAKVQASRDDVRLQEVGSASVTKTINDVISSNLSQAERVSLPITLIVLIFAFGALAAASVPLLLGLTSVAAAAGALALVSQIVPNSDSTSAVVAVIGLAVGIDYSLFYVRREREERRRGLPESRPRRRDRKGGGGAAQSAAGSRGESALEAAAASVGRAILISGCTVIIALSGLLITGQGDFLSMGLGTILVVAIAVVGSLTVLPAVLALLGDRVDRGRIPGIRRLRARRARREDAAGHPVGVWAGLARTVTKRPAVWLVAAVFVLGGVAIPLFGMQTGPMTVKDLPQDLPVVSAAQAITESFPGAPADAVLVVRGSGLGDAAAQSELAALGARALSVTDGRGGVTVVVSGDQTLARVDVPMPDRGDDAARQTVNQLRTVVAPSAGQVPGASGAALVTGDVAAGLDYSDRMASATPQVIAFVLALGFLLLLLTFRAPLLAAGIMLLNLLSIGATYGILVMIFQHTWAEGLLSFHSTGQIINWLPLFMFVILFGLSMDYTVLILERIREARRAGLPPRRAAADGVAATAGTVTSAALVMVAVFGVFGTLDVVTFKQLGIGLAAAVLVDATLVRGVALPALVALLGRRGWRVPVAADPGLPEIAGRGVYDDASMVRVEWAR